MFDIGDIVEIYAPTVGYKKYHLCVAVGRNGDAYQFLFLNSDDGFRDTFVFGCERIPCLPPSKTGKTAFSFSMIPRYSEEQLKLYNARKLGVLEKSVAKELLEVSNDVTSLPRGQLQRVQAALNLFLG